MEDKDRYAIGQQDFKTLRKGYAGRFSTDSRHIFKIGVSFSSETRRIKALKIED